MSIEKVPFVPYKTEEERAKDTYKVITVRLNQKDQELMVRLKQLYDVASDSTILKIALHDYHHILHQRFSAEFIEYLFKKKRDRLSDYRDIDKPTIDQNVGGLKAQNEQSM